MDLFESLQIMQESKSHRKVIKEDRDNLSVSEYNKLKIALNKHNPMKNNFILHPGEVRKPKDSYKLEIAIYGAFKNQEHSQDSIYVWPSKNTKNDEATRDGVGIRLYNVYINLIDESIKFSDIFDYYIDKYINMYKKYLINNDIIANEEIDIKSLKDSIKSTTENSKKDLEVVLHSKNFIYNLTGKRKVQPSNSTKYNLNLENESLLKEAYSKDIPNEILDMIKDSSRVRDAFIEIGLDPSKMIIDKVDKFHKNNPNYIPIEIYEYNLDDSYSREYGSRESGIGIKIGNIDINKNTDRNLFTPGTYVTKTNIVGIYEIDITKNIENNAIIGDKIELRAINKNDPKNQYLDRTNPDDNIIDKSGYLTAGNFKSSYGKKLLKHRRDIMQKNTHTDESLLKEDFDPSMPNWLMRVLKMDNANGGHKDRNYHMPLDVMKWEVEPFPNKGKLDDISKDEFVALLVDKSGDSHKGDYIVYFPSALIGNNETININGKNRRIDSMSLKALAPYVKEYAHSINKFDALLTIRNKQKDRATAQGGSINRIDPKDSWRYPFSRNNIDKSGYIVDPNKYVKLLAQLHQQDYANRLEDLYVVLSDVKNKIKDFMSADDFLPDAKDDASAYTVDSKSKSRYFAQISKNYNDAISDYKHALGELDNISKSKNADWSNTPAYVEFNKYVKRSEESTVKVLNIIDKSK